MPARLQLKSEEKTEILNALAGPVYLTTRVRRPLLLRLDSLLADEGAEYHYSRISIEHVLPQNPDPCSQWMTSFPDEDERMEWTHRLANLVLFVLLQERQGAELRVRTQEKRILQNETASVPFALTIQVLNESEWTPEVLERRQCNLINALKKEWRPQLSIAPEVMCFPLLSIRAIRTG